MIGVLTTTSRPRPSSGLLTPQLAAAGLVIMWSSGFVGARLGTEHATADTLLAWRFLIAAALLVAWTVVRGSWVPRGHRLRHVVIGSLTQCGYLGGVVTGVGLGVPAGTAALIAALQPLLVGAVAGRIVGERITRPQWWGLWLGVVGVAMVVAGDVGRGGAPLAAYLLPIGGMVSLSVGTVLERRWRPAGTLVQAMTVHVLTAVAFFVSVAAISGHLGPPAELSFAAAVAWTVVLSHFGGYGFYLLVLRQRGATRVSTLLYLTPPTTVIWAFAMFGDPLSPTGLAGLAVCAVAVWMVLRGRSGDDLGPVRVGRLGEIVRDEGGARSNDCTRGERPDRDKPQAGACVPPGVRRIRHHGAQVGLGGAVLPPVLRAPVRRRG